MNRLIPGFCTFLALFGTLVTTTHATEETLTAMTDSERVALVFPFEVGQQYEFKSAWTFTRPNGDTLAPHTVATITVTDTLINGETYLHIPYWSPFGTEYYRLDDSLRVWNHNPVTGADSVFLNLGRSGLNVPPPPLMGIRCGIPDGYADMMQATNIAYSCPVFKQDFNFPVHWGYQFQNSSWSDMFAPERILDISSAEIILPTVISVWTILEDQNVLVYSYKTECCPGITWPVFPIPYGIEGPGSTYHRQGNEYKGIFTWGIFRPAGGTEWDLDDQIIIVGIDDDDTDHPSEPDLTAYPNPFNPEVTIRYYLTVANRVNVSVFTTSGQHIRTLTQNYQSAGDHSLNWDGRNAAGTAVGSGVYIICLTNGTQTATTRVTVVR